jgi:LysM repeat protein
MRFRRLLLALGLLLMTCSVQVVIAHADGVHTVRAGENLRNIAAQYGTSVAAILNANNLFDPDLVYAGQQLRIPIGVAEATGRGESYTVQAGETLFGIARHLGVSQISLMQANGLADASVIWAGQRLAVPGGATVAPQEPPAATRRRPHIHVVGPGETLVSLAARYGTTLSALAQANYLTSTNQIASGQRLVIPGGSAPTARPAAPVAGRWIEIDTRRQQLAAYEGESRVFTTAVSTGKPGMETLLGRFAIGRKFISQRMAGPGYDIPNVPWVMYFHGVFAIHGAYWHDDFGRAISHGCVNMRPADAQWLYNWAPVGTPVVVHE